MERRRERGIEIVVYGASQECRWQDRPEQDKEPFQALAGQGQAAVILPRKGIAEAGREWFSLYTIFQTQPK